MKRVIDTSEVVGTVATDHGTFEVCAAGDAKFDEPRHQVVLRLTAFLRPADLLAKERHVHPDWLPRDETITESVSYEECRELVRELFHRWVGKVRDAAPFLHPV